MAVEEEEIDIESVDVLDWHDGAITGLVVSRDELFLAGLLAFLDDGTRVYGLVPIAADAATELRALQWGPFLAAVRSALRDADAPILLIAGDALEGGSVRSGWRLSLTPHKEWVGAGMDEGMSDRRVEYWSSVVDRLRADHG